MPKLEHCDDCREAGILCSQPVDPSLGGLTMFEGDIFLPTDFRFENCPRKNRTPNRTNQKCLAAMIRQRFDIPNITKQLN